MLDESVGAVFEDEEAGDEGADVEGYAVEFHGGHLFCSRTLLVSGFVRSAHRWLQGTKYDIEKGGREVGSGRGEEGREKGKGGTKRKSVAFNAAAPETLVTQQSWRDEVREPT